MASIIIKLFTKEKLANEKIGEDVLNSLVHTSFKPEKVGYYDPLKKAFTNEAYMELWMKEYPGCYEEAVGMVGTAGGIIVKGKKPNFSMYTYWWDCPNQEDLNSVNMFLPKTVFLKYQSEIEALFKQLIEITHSCYAYISELDVSHQQGNPNFLENQLPGIYWANYLDQNLLTAIGTSNFERYPWNRIENEVADGKVYYLANNPFEACLINGEYIEEAKIQIGETYFAEKHELFIDR